MISYKPLFHTLLEKNLKLKDLDGILPKSVTSKFNKNLHVTTSTLEKLCLFLECKVEDVIEILPDQDESPQQDQA